MIKRFSIFIIGLIALAFGISLLVKADIGTAPWDSVFVGLQDNFGLTIGTWSTIVACCAMILNSLIMRSRPLVEGFIAVIILNLFLDFFLLFIHPAFNLDYTGANKYFYYLIGVFAMGIGIGTYTYANVTRTPLDMLCANITKMLGDKIVVGRTAFEFSALVLGLILGGPIGIGTVVFVFSVGLIIRETQKCISKFIPEFKPLKK